MASPAHPTISDSGRSVGRVAGRGLRLVVAIAAAVAVVRAAGLDPGRPAVGVDWPSCLAQHDLVWEVLPRQWNEGAFVGNGGTGLMLYATLGDNRLDFHVGRCDVTDHRLAPGARTSRGVEGATVMYDFPRLDVGRLALRPAGRIISGRLRQRLWDAEITGTITTDRGGLSIRCFVPHDRMVHVIEVESTERDPDGRPAAWSWEFRAGNPASPRAQVFPERAESLAYRTNPSPTFGEVDGVPVCVQPLLAGGDYASAWLEQPAVQGHGSTLYFSTANEVPQSQVSAAVAVRTVRAAAAVGTAGLLSPHRDWWHAFYRQSFLAIPNARLESFYWIQLYKLACCSRPGGEAIDLFGPFFRVSQWPGLWWNLNVQLTYSPVYPSNHLELGENFLTLMDRQLDSLLRANGGGTLGDTVWALHNYWLHLRYAGDWPAIQSRWLPKAEQALACYRTKLERHDDGLLHLGPMGSPEYHGFTLYPDNNYNIALLRWLLSALVEAGRAGGEANPQVEAWDRLHRELVPFQVDADGLRIAANQPLDMSHRHYSHLLGLYPLFQLDPESAADRLLVEKSIRHWHQIDGGKALAGYSFTGAASLWAALGRGDEAESELNTFLTGKIGISALLANTFYVEGGGRNPVIETPLSAAAATLELVLQSWGGKIRVFPAVPPGWAEACFHQLRAQGGFLVSAERRAARTAWISIVSLQGEPCRLKVPDWSGALQATGKRVPTVVETSPGDYTIDLRAGESVLLRRRGSSPAAIVTAGRRPDAALNPYGVKAGGSLPTDQSWSLPEYGAVSPRR